MLDIRHFGKKGKIMAKKLTPEQIFEKLVHQDTDFSFLIRGTEGKSNYIARSSNHDCNSSFVLSFSNPKEVA